MAIFESGRRRWIRLGVVAASVTALAGSWLVVGGGDAAATVTHLKTFSVSGQYSWTVPAGVTKITITAYGASGGNVVDNSGPFPTLISAGGSGGEAKGTFAVTPGETFVIIVGGQGANATGSTGGLGGSNGGGYGGSVSSGWGGGGGGGESDVRIGAIGDPCGSKCGYLQRFIVGGGGGGGGYNSDGSAGGGLDGGGSGGGGQSGSFDCSGSNGCFLYGGNGTSTDGAGGGGGGWFGGWSGSSNGGGSGGSGYINGLALSGSFPGGTRGGDGLVKIVTP